jgi:cytochrome c-type biogenesis protein CcmH/NrfG
MRGDRAEALQQFREALKLRPDWPQPMSEIAWLLATSPDPSVRNPAEATRLAERAASLTSGREPTVLDTLAAAYAAEGRFEDAVEAAERAVAAAAGAPGLAAELRSRLELYRSGRPFVEASRTRAAPR